MVFVPDELFNIADYFLDARVREGMGDRTAVISDRGETSYSTLSADSNRVGNVLRELGVRQEDRVLIALPDGPEFVAVLFGILKIGAVVVMVNPQLKPAQIAYFLSYTRARLAVVHDSVLGSFEGLAEASPHLDRLLVVGAGEGVSHPRYERLVEAASSDLVCAATHRDDAAIWLFSGGTTGHPKAVVQSHRSFANTTELYAKNAMGFCKDDITLSVPKLYFGYATGSNLLFPFSVGGATVLFADKPTPETLFEKIRAHRPTILINVPTVINRMVSHPDAAAQDFSCLRFATSAGEALPVALHDRWADLFGVDLFDGLGTAEMWHVFVTNRVGASRPGTLGTVVEGFEIAVRDAGGVDVADGEIGELWVRGDSRAIGYWQQMDKTQHAFRGQWYVSGDLIRRDSDGYITYCGRQDDMLKVTGKWVSPKEIENSLLGHPAVRECAVVGMRDDRGLVKPYAFVIPKGQQSGARAALATALQQHVIETLAPYKAPREVFLVDDLPRTHLGKVDRGKLRRVPGDKPG